MRKTKGISKRKSRVVNNKTLERVKNPAHTHTKNSSKWLDRLALFLCAYATVTFFWATITDTGVPLFWTLFVVFPSIGIYKFFEWLWM